MQEKIKQVLEKIRPHLQMDGGDVDFISYNPETGIVKLALKGACVGCPMSQITLQEGIGKLLKEEVPEIKGVESV